MRQWWWLMLAGVVGVLLSGTDLAAGPYRFLDFSQAAVHADAAIPWAEWQTEVAEVMALSEEELLRWVPERSAGIHWTTCPHCNRRTRVARWIWRPEAPWQITCEDCQTVYPNERYPESGVMAVRAPEGMHRFTYYPEDRSRLAKAKVQDPAGLNATQAAGSWELDYTQPHPEGALFPPGWSIAGGAGGWEDFRQRPLPDGIGEALWIRGVAGENRVLRGPITGVLPAQGVFELLVEAGTAQGASDRSSLTFTLGQRFVELRVVSNHVELRDASGKAHARLPFPDGRIVPIRLTVDTARPAITALEVDGQTPPDWQPLELPAFERGEQAVRFSFFVTTPFVGEVLLKRVAVQVDPALVGPPFLEQAVTTSSVSEPRRLFFAETAAYHRRVWLQRQAMLLGRLYAHTGEERYARRAFLILRRFAEVYPGYPYKYDGIWHERQVMFAPFDQPQWEPVGRSRQTYQPTKWDFWAYMDISEALLQSFQAIGGWEGWQSPEGRTGRERIVRDLLSAQVEHVLRFPETYHNMSVSHSWPAMLYAARVLERPEWMHRTIGNLETFLTDRFLHDGHWFETSPSYANQVIGGLTRIGRVVEGYSDPVGYAHPETGRRFEAMDLLRELPVYAAARSALLRPRLPNGRMLPINDTWPYGRPFEPLERTEPLLLPGLGVAVLGGGEGDAQLHAHLNFSSGTSHKQHDALSMGLFAFGHELFRDLGYTHTRYRAWNRSTASHNTVMIDGRDSALDPEHTGQRLELFALAPEAGVQVVSARSQTAYPQAQRYRRTLVLMDESYLLDLFEVQGGRQHDYLLHGSADEDVIAEFENGTLVPFTGSLMNSGVRFVRPTSETTRVGRENGLGFIHSLQRGAFPQEPAGLQLRLADSPHLGTRSLLWASGPAELFLGQAPSIRRTGGRHFHEEDALLDRYQAPVWVVRRQGEDLKSLFVAVHEPLRGSSRIAALAVETRGDAVICQVTRTDGQVDHLFWATQETAEVHVATPQGPIHFAGRFGVLRQQGEQSPAAVLVAGTHFEQGPLKLGNAAAWQGRVTEAGSFLKAGRYGGYLTVDVPIAADARFGALQAVFPDGSERAWNVVGVEATIGGSRLQLAEIPGFELAGDQIRFTSHPPRTMPAGEIRFVLPRVVSSLQP